MSEDNYSSASVSCCSPKERRTFSEFATPTTPISTPSYLSPLASSPSGSSIAFSDEDSECYETESDASVSLGTLFTDRELVFIENTVKSFLSSSGFTNDLKVIVCDSFQEFGLFELDAECHNNSFQIYHEILTRIAYRVQKNILKCSVRESRLKYYAPIDSMVEMTIILIHLSNLCTKECLKSPTHAEPAREFEKYEKTLMFINRLLNTLSTHMNKINIDCPHDVEFPTLSYYRFIMELLKRLIMDRGLLNITSEITSTFCILLHDISPKSIPTFAYQWMSIIGSGTFLRQVLDTKYTELEVLYSHHLLLLLDFLKPFLLCRELSRTKCVMEYYFGLTRLLFVIHHDFPNFFVRHGFQFIEFVPISNIQLRCIILSTLPTYVCPTSPFLAGAFVPSCLDHLEMDLSAFNNNPEFDYHEWCLRQCGVLEELIEYLEERGPMGFLLQLRHDMDQNAIHPDLPRNWREPEMRAVICFTAAAHIRTLDWTWETLPTFENLGDSSFMDIYQILALALDESGRALFFSLIVDRLRYPSVETYYFFMVLARLFTTLKNQIVKDPEEAIPNLFWSVDAWGARTNGSGPKEIWERFLREQLITSLLQRILAYPPHQWGVLAAFTELIQNPVFNFWKQPFLKRNASTALLFDTISRTWRRQYKKFD